MTIDELRTKAAKFQSSVHRRNLREYAGGILVIAFFVWFLFSSGNPIVRVGSGLIIMGSLYAGYQLFRKGSVKAVPAGMGLTNCLDFHRRSLERQHELLRSVWSWYLGPFLPGLAVFLLGGALASPNRMTGLAVFAISGTTMGLAFAWIARLNARAARLLQTEIDAVDRLRIES
jgi:hypothetical protein